MIQIIQSPFTLYAAIFKYTLASFFINNLVALHVHNPSIGPTLSCRDSDGLARFGLHRNPFAIRSAEQAHNSSIFYSKDTSSSKEGCIVLGASGSGKTALRLKIDEDLLKDENPFVVSLTDPFQIDRWLAEFERRRHQVSLYISASITSHLAG